jgi:hypothetical protein
MSTTVFAANCPIDPPAASGLFAWNLLSDTLHGDSSVALLFGMDADVLSAGIPIVDLLNRVHEDDRPDFARALHDSVITSHAMHHRFRVSSSDGDGISVMVIGQCFRDSSDTATVYAGIAFAASPTVL